MKKLAKAVVVLLFLAGALGLAGGLPEGVHPVVETLAAFRHYALAALLMAVLGFVLWRQKLLAVLAFGLLAYGGYTIRHQLTTPAPLEEGISLLQSNLRYDNAARLLLDYAKATAPDVITLQEVTTTSIPQLAQMRRDYPYQIICRFVYARSVAILSKHRFAGPPGQGCDEGTGMVSARIELPHGDVSVVSLHLHWPWPYHQAAHLENMLPKLQELERPVVVAGDFNMVPWAAPVSAVGAATGTRVVGGLRFTKALFGGLVQLPIDQVLVPVGWQASAQTGPKLGSDHNSVLLRFSR